ncbi:putative methyltransferase-like protein 7A [Pyrus x bretschneideri]|uniref:putative methyltransferase-like protein 7A n=1 Tax=Pyrus x bretschneideri TaxID=225117 RepID=UPI00202E0954|nr:putative methyltransferase-like protein 7A [Pyrus x bretschneideri]
MNAWAMLEKVHPPSPDRCEEFYASVLNTSMKSYDDEIAGYKAELLAELKGKAEQVLEIGIGTGPNLRYYAADSGVRQGLGRLFPLDDASVDAVVGTLVLCSVKDVDNTLKGNLAYEGHNFLFVRLQHELYGAAADGTILRFIHNVLDPLQQTLADGCRLTWETRSKHNCDHLVQIRVLGN